MTAPAYWGEAYSEQPRQAMPDDHITELYAGQKYDDFTGREIIDHTPVFRPLRHSPLRSTMEGL